MIMLVRVNRQRVRRDWMRMRARWLEVAFLGAVLLTVVVTATAQPVAKVSRVGILDGGSPFPERQALWNEFKEALREAGYDEGRNVVFEFRWTSGQPGLAQDMANELVRANVDVIVTAGTPVALAAKQATTKYRLFWSSRGIRSARGWQRTSVARAAMLPA